MQDFRSGIKDLKEFLRTIAHSFGRLIVTDEDEEELPIVVANEEVAAIGMPTYYTLFG